VSVDYDPFSHEVMADPWPYYARLREEAPAFYLERYDTWFLSRFDDIWNATVSNAFSAERGVTPEQVMLKVAPSGGEVSAFTTLDMPRHRVYRRLLSPRYTRNAVAKMEDHVRGIARELLAPLVERGEFDVHRDYANPLATTVIGELLGIEREDALALRALVETLFAREPGQVGTSPEGDEAQARIFQRFGEIVQERAERGDVGGDDHLGAMLAAEVGGEKLSMVTVLSNAFSMLVTGAEVVPLSVANTAVYLHELPDTRRALVRDPSLIPHAFAESLRYDQPTNLLGRILTEDVELHGQKLRAGSGVMFLWASGNRDEREFESADVFDIARRPRRSLSYGHGIHKCIGEHLGNLEGRILLEELLAAAPEYEVDTTGAVRAYSEFLHGYHRVPISVP